jgi:hypothetical protein
MISKVVILVILLSVTSARAQSDRHNTSLNQAWLSCKVSESPNAVRGEGHWILYTLDDYYALDSTYFWNFNTPQRINNYDNQSWSLHEMPGTLKDGIKKLAIDVSLDGLVWEEAAVFELDEGTGSGFYTGESGPDLKGRVAKYILLSGLENHGGSCYGLSEIRVGMTPAIINKVDPQDITKPQIYISLYPNPSAGEINVGINGFAPGDVDFKVTNVSGVTVKEGIWKIESRFQQIRSLRTELDSGIYYLSVYQGDVLVTLPFDIFK